MNGQPMTLTRLINRVRRFLVNRDPRRFDTKLLFERDDLKPLPGQGIAVFGHWDPSGQVADYVMWHLRALREAGLSVIFLSTSSQLDKAAVERLSPLCWMAGTRVNRGLDIGGWPCGVLLAERRLGPNALAGRRLVFTNDSVFGPLFPLQSTMERMGSGSLDLWSMSDSWEKQYHLQSFFLCVEPSGMRFFREWLDSFEFLFDREAIIMRYEVGLTPLAQRAGLELGAWAPSERASTLDKRLNKNPTHAGWVERLAEGRLAYLKRDLMRTIAGNPVLLRERDEAIARSGSNYPVELMDGYLAGVADHTRRSVHAS